VDDRDYQVPFNLTGKLIKLTLAIDRPKLTPEDEKKLMKVQRNNKVSEQDPRTHRPALERAGR
jgi:arylsulfatase